MTRGLPLLLLGCLALATPLYAEDAVQEKIRQLEEQIQELKALKAEQDAARQKTEQCMKAVGAETFCSCVGKNLPAAVSFEEYVHGLITPKEQLGYSTMSSGEKKRYDSIQKTREQCVEKGFSSRSVETIPRADKQ